MLDLGNQVRRRDVDEVAGGKRQEERHVEVRRQVVRQQRAGHNGRGRYEVGYERLVLSPSPTNQNPEVPEFLGNLVGSRGDPGDHADLRADDERRADGQTANEIVQAIRQQETQDGVAPHLVAVQGTGGWARLLKYYIEHPIPGGNVIYETHVYNPEADFNNLVTTPAQTLPVIIGEFGQWSGLMSLTDTQALMTLADGLKVPWAAWTFHMRCSPNLLVDYSAGGCGVGMNLEATEFGNQVKQNLQRTRR